MADLPPSYHIINTFLTFTIALIDKCQSCLFGRRPLQWFLDLYSLWVSFPWLFTASFKKKKTWSISNQNTASPNSGDSVLFCFFTSGPKLTFMHGIILGHLIFSQIFFTIKTVKEKMQYIEDEHSVYCHICLMIIYKPARRVEEKLYIFPSHDIKHFYVRRDGQRIIICIA